MNFFSSREKQRSFQESRAVRVELFNFSEKISIFFSFMVQKRVLWHPQFQGYFKNCPYMVYAAPIKTSTKMTLKHSIGMLKNAEKSISQIFISTRHWEFVIQIGQPDNKFANLIEFKVIRKLCQAQASIQALKAHCGPSTLIC